jgi:hypothetical protein
MKLENVKVVAEIDTKDVAEIVSNWQQVRDELRTQIALNVFNPSRVKHLIPTTEMGMGRDELGELVSLFFHLFDTTCVNHCLKGLKVSVLPDKIIWE